MHSHRILGPSLCPSGLAKQRGEEPIFEGNHCKQETNTENAAFFGVTRGSAGIRRLFLVLGCDCDTNNKHHPPPLLSLVPVSCFGDCGKANKEAVCTDLILRRY